MLIINVFCPNCLEEQEIDSDERECPSCGSTIPDRIVDMAEEIRHLKYKLKQCEDQLSFNDNANKERS